MDTEQYSKNCEFQISEFCYVIQNKFHFNRIIKHVTVILLLGNPFLCIHIHSLTRTHVHTHTWHKWEKSYKKFIMISNLFWQQTKSFVFISRVFYFQVLLANEIENLKRYKMAYLWQDKIKKRTLSYFARRWWIKNVYVLILMVEWCSALVQF